MTIFSGRRVKVPLFEISSQPKVNLSDIKNRRYNLFLGKCPVCGEQLSDKYPYHPENGCLYGIIYNITEE